MKVFLIIGACGSGKTWIMKEVIKKYSCNTLGKVGMFYFHRNNSGLVVLGKYDGSTFEGSDKLSMAIMRDLPEFLEWCKKEKFNVVCEGDRFTNETFIREAKPTMIGILDDGTNGRSKRGSNQTERQIKAIQTKVKNKLPLCSHQVKDSKEAYKTLVKML
jgi:predicted NACHT family NTPase